MSQTDDDQKQSDAEAASRSTPVDDVRRTEHTLTLDDGRTLAYTAATGRIVLSPESIDDDVFKGTKPRAEMSVTSYVAEPEEGRSRPVTFAFNGGPGSSSVWLHLGLLGPRRVLSGDVGDLAAPPYGLTDNPQSLLAVSDLVFIDPVSTGWSRAVEGGKPKDFHGFQADIDSVAELIRLWVTRHGRWLSPKFLIGESYGTVRAAALAEHLQDKLAMYLNGVVLVSSIIDFDTSDFEYRNDRAYVDYLPTYAATAHFHGFHGERPLREVLDEAEAYAARDYPWALARGSRLTADERQEVVDRLASLTGLSPAYIDRSNLRVEHVRFFTELLRDRGLAVGRLDARFTGPLRSGIAEQWDADPSFDAVMGPYAAAFNHYVRTELGYDQELAYVVSSDRAHKEWSYKEYEAKPIDVTAALSRALRANPHLRVHVAYGYYDGATPYWAAEDAFAHLDVPADLLGNLEHRYYEAGHMMYVHEPSRRRQSAELRTFVEGASGR
ncbi:Peptidase S10, serine carboxypeptidase [Nostocoides japonicum T1-X7]|uniref:Peptidase S10, serine carboxypeptidase n=1 Tax=Nostocoides japonicum T1-X7 TaxID=1194083 RepID=A0A077LZ44_9MICO|nr:peptidase S10 [Tetrasphaera japonica]CCH77239.1 Peptidase S10, serine carboxypeptidase [Tetrasphaera japonica T1-X7]